MNGGGEQAGVLQASRQVAEPKRVMARLNTRVSLLEKQEKHSCCPLLHPLL